MKERVTRRRFLATGAAGVGSLLLASGRALGANERIVTGHIGVGGMGSGHLRTEAAAICDVDESHRLEAKSRVPNADLYNDYRDVLDRKDVDAVIIATPDHWHALMTIHACEAGKDVYVEKPAAKTIREGRWVVEAARRYGRVVQVGSQGRSTPAARAGAQYVRNGCLGKVSRVTCWHYPNPVDDSNTPDSDPPKGLDWDLWVGPARWVPYHPLRCHFNFRWFLDFGGGQIRDRGAHVLSVVCWAMGADETGPVSVEATGTPPKVGLFDCPVEMEVKYEFRNPDWTLTWSQPGVPEMGAGFGSKYWGDKDTLVITGGDGGCGTEGKALSAPVPPGGVELPASPGHKEDWFACIKTRKRPIMDIAIGHRVSTLCILGNIAYRIGRKLAWDPVAERFIGDEEADRMLHQPYRAPWVL